MTSPDKAAVAAVLLSMAAILSSCDGTNQDLLDKWQKRTLGYAFARAWDGSTLHYRIVEKHGDESLVLLCDNPFITGPTLWPTSQLVATDTKCDEDARTLGGPDAG